MQLTRGQQPPARRARGRQQAGRVLVPDENPAIPLSQVPFFTADLLRLAVTAIVMIALLIVGAKLVIPLAMR
ncbi:MAG: hypothetical protein WAM30_18525 [Candidatus Dormiibacterota bacterium]